MTNKKLYPSTQPRKIRCKGVKANGTPCRRWADTGNDYCSIHRADMKYAKMMKAKGFPLIPSKWTSRKHGTRHVVDRTLGWDVVYFEGRLPYAHWNKYGKQCTLEEWLEYRKHAKRIK